MSRRRKKGIRASTRQREQKEEIAVSHSRYKFLKKKVGTRGGKKSGVGVGVRENHT